MSRSNEARELAVANHYGDSEIADYVNDIVKTTSSTGDSVTGFEIKFDEAIPGRLRKVIGLKDGENSDWINYPNLFEG